MQVDWVVSVVVFLVFVGWAFSYYLNIIPATTETISAQVAVVQDKILDFLEIDIYSVPVKYNSTNSTNNSILYFDFRWPLSKNSSKILKNSSQLPCKIIDNRTYFQANLTQGMNYFSFEFANVTGDLNCTADFTIVNESLAEIWVQEKKKLVSQSKINEMQATSYDSFRDSLSITRDFRIEIEKTGSTISYGKTIPAEPPPTGVYVPVTSNKIWESDEVVNMSIAVW